jgi:hypothetical protein
MLKSILPAAALLVLVLPAELGAYGAVHRGYTHVGPNGVYHTGRTAVATPYGVAATRNTNVAGYGGYRGGAAYGAGYRYTPGYGGVPAYGGYRYGYIR